MESHFEPRGHDKAMNITVRYRDIPWEEAKKCATERHYISDKTPGNWEANYRSKPVVIRTPGSTRRYSWIACGGPFFDVVGKPTFVVCPHIAEIGD